MTATMRDHTTPEEGAKWEFDAGVTAVFDDMLQRSIPQYEVMRKLTFDIGQRFVERGSTVVDLGCSRGEALVPFVDKYGALCRYVGVEVSEPMRQAALERFAGLIEARVADIRDTDLRYDYPPVANVSLTLSVLTVQFIPIEYRQRLFSDIYRSLAPGGALILVEKVLADGATLDDLFVTRYLKMKSENGYSQEEIDRKRYSLEGVLVPVTAKWNEELMRSAGFRTVDCFWRWLNFAGWIAVKGDRE